MSEHDPYEERADLAIEMLLEQGALEIMSIDENGEPIYRITAKCREVFPEFYYSHIQEVNQTSFDLWQLGVVTIIFSEEGERISYNKENYEKFLEIESTLTQEQKGIVNVLMDSNMRTYASKFLID
jgi:hypothetical protein